MSALPNDPQKHRVSVNILRTMLASDQRILSARPLTAVNTDVEDCAAIRLYSILYDHDTLPTNPIIKLPSWRLLITSHKCVQHTSGYKISGKSGWCCVAVNLGTLMFLYTVRGLDRYKNYFSINSISLAF